MKKKHGSNDERLKKTLQNYTERDKIIYIYNYYTERGNFIIDSTF